MRMLFAFLGGITPWHKAGRKILMSFPSLLPWPHLELLLFFFFLKQLTDQCGWELLGFAWDSPSFSLRQLRSPQQGSNSPGKEAAGQGEQKRPYSSLILLVGNVVKC